MVRVSEYSVVAIMVRMANLREVGALMLEVVAIEVVLVDREAGGYLANGV